MHLAYQSRGASDQRVAGYHGIIAPDLAPSYAVYHYMPDYHTFINKNMIYIITIIIIVSC